MRHNSEIKIKVRKLRERGLSLDQIHKQTEIPKTTIRTWIKDIKLSAEQLKVLENRVQVALQEGRKDKKRAGSEEIKIYKREKYAEKRHKRYRKIV